MVNWVFLWPGNFPAIGFLSKQRFLFKYPLRRPLVGQDTWHGQCVSGHSVWESLLWHRKRLARCRLGTRANLSIVSSLPSYLLQQTTVANCGLCSQNLRVLFYGDMVGNFKMVKNCVMSRATMALGDINWPFLFLSPKEKPLFEKPWVKLSTTSLHSCTLFIGIKLFGSWLYLGLLH